MAERKSKNALRLRCQTADKVEHGQSEGPGAEALLIRLSLIGMTEVMPFYKTALDAPVVSLKQERATIAM